MLFAFANTEADSCGDCGNN